MNGAGVTGRVSAGALAKASRMFDQSLASIVSELVQNARRAGARTVHVTTTDDSHGAGRACFSDDGRGVGDMQAMLTFGRSDWDETVTAVEDVGGMGVFCLSSRGCTVTSRGLRATMTPGTFEGTEDAAVEEVAYAAGTQVSFPLRPQGAQRQGRHRDVTRELHMAVLAECRCAPLDVTLDGEPIPRTSFLAGLLPLSGIDGAAVAMRGHEMLPDAGCASDAINFYGHMARVPEAVVAWTLEGAVIARWDVVPGSDLKLTLPTRDRVVTDDAWRRTFLQTRLAACRAIAGAGREHDLSMRDVVFCREHGVEMSLPTVALLEWHPMAQGGDGRRHIRDAKLPKAIIVGAGIGFEAMLALSEVQKHLHAQGVILAHEEPKLDGHPGYDALPRLEAIDVEATFVEDDEVQTERYDGFAIADGPNEGDGEEEGLPGMVHMIEARSIAVTVTISGGVAQDNRLLTNVARCALLACPEGGVHGVVATSTLKNAKSSEWAARAIADFTRDPDDMEEESPRYDVRWRKEVRDELWTLRPKGGDALLRDAVRAVTGMVGDWVERTGGNVAETIAIDLTYEGEPTVVATDGKGRSISEHPLDEDGMY